VLSYQRKHRLGQIGFVPRFRPLLLPVGQLHPSERHAISDQRLADARRLLSLPLAKTKTYPASPKFGNYDPQAREKVISFMFDDFEL